MVTEADLTMGYGLILAEAVPIGHAQPLQSQGNIETHYEIV